MPTSHQFPPVRAEGLAKYFRSGDAVIAAVEDVSLTVEPGEISAILGPSGSGKSTLLQLLAGLDRPDAGTVAVGGTELTGLRDRALTRLRRERIGFIFQDFQLLPRMTAWQNITLPVRLAGGKVDEDEVRNLAETLGVDDRLDHRPSELSGGQQQRVAVARALLGRPDVIFADEPTGALDSVTAETLVDLFTWAAHERGQSFVVVTHDDRVADRADSVHRMSDGHLATVGV
ncbi:MAG TPA: ABC transporter ATP-binding protein [Candidatus Corynebacterium avicola]|uniref:ABC transporter ATP-binding protein n=1 Tax=Candidatus Corynebacterium avicola TaxID=2838527 RepID=A0A9D1RRF9_9CORY|nr:ABC transporter ATP-binding protein [Candidatus Corynebacterium avicola]